MSERVLRETRLPRAKRLIETTQTRGERSPQRTTWRSPQRNTSTRFNDLRNGLNQPLCRDADNVEL